MPKYGLELRTDLRKLRRARSWANQRRVCERPSAQDSPASVQGEGLRARPHNGVHRRGRTARRLPATSRPAGAPPPRAQNVHLAPAVAGPAPTFRQPGASAVLLCRRGRPVALCAPARARWAAGGCSAQRGPATGRRSAPAPAAAAAPPQGATTVAADWLRWVAAGPSGGPPAAATSCAVGWPVGRPFGRTASRRQQPWLWRRSLGPPRVRLCCCFPRSLLLLAASEALARAHCPACRPRNAATLCLLPACFCALPAWFCALPASFRLPAAAPVSRARPFARPQLAGGARTTRQLHTSSGRARAHRTAARDAPRRPGARRFGHWFASAASRRPAS